MKSSKGNIIEEVLKCMALCEQNNATLRNVKADPEKIREYALEIVNEMEQHLCRLVTMFITTPMSGRLFTPLLHENINEEQLQQSLEDQMS
jgi:hypothetical protein